MHLILNKCNRRLLMKISSLAILLTWFATVVAASSTAQNLAGIKASLPSGTVSLKDALKQLEKQTNIRFTYVSSDVNNYKQSRVDHRSANVAMILDDLLENTDLEYQQVGKTVIIKKRSSTPGDITKVQSRTTMVQQERRGRILSEE